VLAEILVAVTIDGTVVDSSQPAFLRDGVVMAPLDPFARDVAQQIRSDPDSERFILERADRRIEISLGSQRARGNAGSGTLPIAPFLREGVPIVPLAAVARALGATVRYDGAAHNLVVGLPPAPALATVAPLASWTPGPGPFPTFSPYQPPTPRPVVTGEPRPRRTPILVESGS
jgi:hypothetical protein